MSASTGTDAVAIAGYLIATPFTVYPPLFKRMWHGDLRLLALHELGVAMIVTGWAARDERVGVVLNGGYGVGLALAYAVAARRRGPREPGRPGAVGEGAAG